MFGAMDSAPNAATSLPAVKVRWQWSRFPELAAAELYAALAARQQVFMVEQHCAFQDADGRECEPGGEPARPRTPAPTRRIIGLRLPQPVGRPAHIAQPAAGIAPRVDQAYWSTNVRMIVVLLLIWFGASFGCATRRTLSPARCR